MKKMSIANIRKELLKLMMVSNCSLDDIEKAIQELRGVSTVNTASSISAPLHYPPGARGGGLIAPYDDKLKDIID